MQETGLNVRIYLISDAIVSVVGCCCGGH